MSENNRWDAGNPDLQEIRDVLQSGGEGEGWKRQVPVSANSVVQPKLTAPYSAPFTTDAPLEGTGNGADEVDCADCGWHGSGNDLASGEDDGHGKRAVCPRCGADEEELSFAGLSRAPRTEAAGAVPEVTRIAELQRQLAEANKEAAKWRSRAKDAEDYLSELGH